MAVKAPNNRSDSVRHAMDRVLDAERDAQAAIESARKRARESLTRTRDHVRRIEERARVLRGRVHAACERRMAERVEQLRAEAGLIESAEHSARVENELIRDACRRLAATLTSRQ